MQLFNLIPPHVIQACKDDYYSRAEYETSSMNKANVESILELVLPYCEQAVEGVIFRGGNFYKHAHPYQPHTDFKAWMDNDLNMVIPLEWHAEQVPSLFVFDQTWPYDSVTWSMHKKVEAFKVNTGVKGAPWEYPIEGASRKPFDEEARKRFLPHFRSVDLFSLTGQAYPFEVGSLIIFDNRRIHATSAFTGEKLGLSLRFKLPRANGVEAGLRSQHL